MIDSIVLVKKLVERYDYCGALEILREKEMQFTDSGVLINACRYAVNFDFATARNYLQHLSEAAKVTVACKDLIENVEALNEGQPDALMSELLENIKFQLVNEEYIDFLGRVYRFKEAIYKFMFMKTQMPDRHFTLQNQFLQKKEILKILRKHHKIYNSNLIFALNTYFKKIDKNKKVIESIVRLMNTDQMNQLIELRHDSLIGHGFRGVSYEEIYKVYGNPYNVLDDFRYCLEKMGVTIKRYKYAELNEVIFEYLEQDFDKLRAKE